ncbi:hypothetical protein QY97_02987 [Bacillus thermotolerans]|nr:hypothetical protein QY97_02987 [Bacillus thermotolerans]KKB42119.1 hypothetical protein QY96_01496 [Bacillus thermotolerans]
MIPLQILPYFEPHFSGYGLEKASGVTFAEVLSKLFFFSLK